MKRSTRQSGKANPADASQDRLALERRIKDVPPELREPDPESPRGRILTAASRLFAERGLTGTSTRAIADEAGVNLAMIHYYFRSKERLYVRVLAGEFLRFRQIVFGAIDFSSEPAEILPTIPIRILAVMRKDPPWAALLRRELADGGKHLIVAFRLLGESGPLGLVEVFAMVYEAGVASGGLRKMPPNPVRECIMSIMFGTLVMQPIQRDLFGRDLADDAIWKEWSETVVSVLKYGVAGEEK
ncbi:TetR family transcriptional regulator [bacterium]|nr:TetR family transcriptional regulator [bacterium]MBU1983726.1 TetR family transcriptional regulator [bacterium]